MSALFLLGGGPGSINFLGRELGLVGGDAPEVGGGARGIPKADNGAEGKVAEGRELEK